MAASAPAHIDAGGDPAADNAIERQDMLAAMRRLTEEQQHVLALRYFAGLSTSEIAQALGKGDHAIYSLQARAIAALRRILRAEAE